MSDAEMNPEATPPVCENCKALAESLRKLEAKYQQVICALMADRTAAHKSEIYPSGIGGERHHPAGDYA